MNLMRPRAKKKSVRNWQIGNWQIGLIAAIVAVGVTAATSHGMRAAPGRTTKIRTVILSGTVSAPSAGACAGFANKCPMGSCTCVQIANAKLSGSAFRPGTAVVMITIDGGDATTSPGCSPIFATASLAPKSSLTATLNIIGTICEPTTAGILEPISGGFSIATATNGATGFGTMTGSKKTTTGAVSLNLSGPVTE